MARRRGRSLQKGTLFWTGSSSRGLITARGVYGFFPANATGDDVALYSDCKRQDVLETFHFLRSRRTVRRASRAVRCLTLLRRARLRYRITWVAFAVTAGIGLKELCDGFRAENDDYNAIMAEAIADRLAEAFAECLHKRVRGRMGLWMR